jgi:hypothetical protein
MTGRHWGERASTNSLVTPSIKRGPSRRQHLLVVPSQRILPSSGLGPRHDNCATAAPALLRWAYYAWGVGGQKGGGVVAQGDAWAWGHPLQVGRISATAGRQG